MGVTFYQLACGKLPFTANNARELMERQVTQQPIALHEIKSSIPVPLSNIVMKLLQKDPDDRYQSAHGLLIDLKKCYQDLMEKGQIIPFNLAQHDFAERFSLPQKLYGRESELTQLKNIYNIARQGQPQVCMITGASGTGKSVLVREIHPYITIQQGLFFIGKFEQLDRTIAYRGIAQAFQGGIKSLLALGEKKSWFGKENCSMRWEFMDS